MNTDWVLDENKELLQYFLVWWYLKYSYLLEKYWIFMGEGMQCLGFEKWADGLNKNGEMLVIVEAG